MVCLVDLFDFHGSLVPELSAIVAEGNPLMLVANKVDLLPKQVTPAAIERWVRSECRRASLPPIDFLDLVSAKTGEGMPRFLERLEKLMSQRRSRAMGCGGEGWRRGSICVEQGGAPLDPVGGYGRRVHPPLARLESSSCGGVCCPAVPRHRTRPDPNRA